MGSSSIWQRFLQPLFNRIQDRFFDQIQVQFNAIQLQYQEDDEWNKMDNIDDLEDEDAYSDALSDRESLVELGKLNYSQSDSNSNLNLILELVNFSIYFKSSLLWQRLKVEEEEEGSILQQWPSWTTVKTQEIYVHSVQDQTNRALREAILVSPLKIKINRNYVQVEVEVGEVCDNQLNLNQLIYNCSGYNCSGYNEFKSNQIKSNELKSNKLKSNKLKSNKLKSNELKSNELKSNKLNSNQIKSNEFNSNQSNSILTNPTNSTHFSIHIHSLHLGLSISTCNKLYLLSHSLHHSQSKTNDSIHPNTPNSPQSHWNHALNLLIPTLSPFLSTHQSHLSSSFPFNSLLLDQLHQFRTQLVPFYLNLILNLYSPTPTSWLTFISIKSKLNSPQLHYIELVSLKLANLIKKIDQKDWNNSIFKSEIIDYFWIKILFNLIYIDWDPSHNRLKDARTKIRKWKRKQKPLFQIEINQFQFCFLIQPHCKNSNQSQYPIYSYWNPDKIQTKSNGYRFLLNTIQWNGKGSLLIESIYAFGMPLNRIEKNKIESNQEWIQNCQIYPENKYLIISSQTSPSLIFNPIRELTLTKPMYKCQLNNWYISLHPLWVMINQIRNQIQVEQFLDGSNMEVEQDLNIGNLKVDQFLNNGRNLKAKNEYWIPKIKLVVNEFQLVIVSLNKVGNLSPIRFNLIFPIVDLDFSIFSKFKPTTVGPNEIDWKVTLKIHLDFKLERFSWRDKIGEWSSPTLLIDLSEMDTIIESVIELKKLKIKYLNGFFHSKKPIIHFSQLDLQQYRYWIISRDKIQIYQLSWIKYILNRLLWSEIQLDLKLDQIEFVFDSFQNPWIQRESCSFLRLDLDQIGLSFSTHTNFIPNSTKLGLNLESNSALNLSEDGSNLGLIVKIKMISLNEFNFPTLNTIHTPNSPILIVSPIPIHQSDLPNLPKHQDSPFSSTLEWRKEEGSFTLKCTQLNFNAIRLLNWITYFRTSKGKFTRNNLDSCQDSFQTPSNNTPDFINLFNLSLISKWNPDNHFDIIKCKKCNISQEKLILSSLNDEFFNIQIHHFNELKINIKFQPFYWVFNFQWISYWMEKIEQWKLGLGLGLKKQVRWKMNIDRIFLFISNPILDKDSISMQESILFTIKEMVIMNKPKLRNKLNYQDWKSESQLSVEWIKYSSFNPMKWYLIYRLADNFDLRCRMYKYRAGFSQSIQETAICQRYSGRDLMNLTSWNIQTPIIILFLSPERIQKIVSLLGSNLLYAPSREEMLRWRKREEEIKEVNDWLNKMESSEASKFDSKWQWYCQQVIIHASDPSGKELNGMESNQIQCNPIQSDWITLNLTSLSIIYLNAQRPSPIWKGSVDRIKAFSNNHCPFLDTLNLNTSSFTISIDKDGNWNYMIQAQHWMLQQLEIWIQLGNETFKVYQSLHFWFQQRFQRHQIWSRQFRMNAIKWEPTLSIQLDHVNLQQDVDNLDQAKDPKDYLLGQKSQILVKFTKWMIHVCFNTNSRQMVTSIMGLEINRLINERKDQYAILEKMNQPIEVVFQQEVEDIQCQCKEIFKWHLSRRDIQCIQYIWIELSNLISSEEVGSGKFKVEEVKVKKIKGQVPIETKVQIGSKSGLRYENRNKSHYFKVEETLQSDILINQPWSCPYFSSLTNGMEASTGTRTEIEEGKREMIRRMYLTIKDYKMNLIYWIQNGLNTREKALFNVQFSTRLGHFQYQLNEMNKWSFDLLKCEASVDILQDKWMWTPWIEDGRFDLKVRPNGCFIQSCIIQANFSTKMIPLFQLYYQDLSIGKNLIVTTTEWPKRLNQEKLRKIDQVSLVIKNQTGVNLKYHISYPTASNTQLYQLYSGCREVQVLKGFRNWIKNEFGSNWIDFDLCLSNNIPFFHLTLTEWLQDKQYVSYIPSSTIMNQIEVNQVQIMLIKVKRMMRGFEMRLTSMRRIQNQTTLDLKLKWRYPNYLIQSVDKLRFDFDEFQGDEMMLKQGEMVWFPMRDACPSVSLCPINDDLEYDWSQWIEYNWEKKRSIVVECGLSQYAGRENMSDSIGSNGSDGSNGSNSNFYGPIHLIIHPIYNPTPTHSATHLTTLLIRPPLVLCNTTLIQCAFQFKWHENNSLSEPKLKPKVQTFTSLIQSGKTQILYQVPPDQWQCQLYPFQKYTVTHWIPSQSFRTYPTSQSTQISYLDKPEKKNQLQIQTQWIKSTPWISFYMPLLFCNLTRLNLNLSIQDQDKWTCYHTNQDEFVDEFSKNKRDKIYLTFNQNNYPIPDPIPIPIGGLEQKQNSPKLIPTWNYIPHSTSFFSLEGQSLSKSYPPCFEIITTWYNIKSHGIDMNWLIVFPRWIINNQSGKVILIRQEDSFLETVLELDQLLPWYWPSIRFARRFQIKPNEPGWKWSGWIEPSLIKKSRIDFECRHESGKRWIIQWQYEPIPSIESILPDLNTSDWWCKGWKKKKENEGKEILQDEDNQMEDIRMWLKLVDMKKNPMVEIVNRSWYCISVSDYEGELLFIEPGKSKCWAWHRCPSPDPPLLQIGFDLGQEVEVEINLEEMVASRKIKIISDELIELELNLIQVGCDRRELVVSSLIGSSLNQSNSNQFTPFHCPNTHIHQHFQFTLNLLILNLSIISPYPQEWTNLNITNTTLDFINHVAYQTIHLQFGKYQIDNQINPSKYKVILHVNSNKKNKALELIIIRGKKQDKKTIGNWWKGERIYYIEMISQPILLQLEEKWFQHLVPFFSSFRSQLIQKHGYLSVQSPYLNYGKKTKKNYFHWIKIKNIKVDFCYHDDLFDNRSLSGKYWWWPSQVDHVPLYFNAQWIRNSWKSWTQLSQYLVQKVVIQFRKQILIIVSNGASSMVGNSASIEKSKEISSWKRSNKSLLIPMNLGLLKGEDFEKEESLFQLEKEGSLVNFEKKTESNSIQIEENKWTLGLFVQKRVMEEIIQDGQSLSLVDTFRRRFRFESNVLEIKGVERSREPRFQCQGYPLMRYDHWWALGQYILSHIQGSKFHNDTLMALIPLDHGQGIRTGIEIEIETQLLLLTNQRIICLKTDRNGDRSRKVKLDWVVNWENLVSFHILNDQENIQGKDENRDWKYLEQKQKELTHIHLIYHHQGQKLHVNMPCPVGWEQANMLFKWLKDVYTVRSREDSLDLERTRNVFFKWKDIWKHWPH